MQEDFPELFPKGGEQEKLNAALEYLDRFSETYNRLGELLTREGGDIAINYYKYIEEVSEEKKIKGTLEYDDSVVNYGVFLEKHTQFERGYLDNPVKTQRTLLLHNENIHGQTVFTIMHNVFEVIDPLRDIDKGTFNSALLHVHPGGIIDYRQKFHGEDAIICERGEPPTNMSPIIKYKTDEINLAYCSYYVGDYLYPVDIFERGNWSIDEVEPEWYITWTKDLEYIDSLFDDYGGVDVKLPISY